MISRFDGYWVGRGYPMPQKWALKKDMPRLDAGIRAVRLAFRFCVAYVQIDRSDSILMADGQWCPIWDMHLANSHRVIGPRDFNSAEGTQYESLWRGAAMDRRQSEMMDKV